MFGAHMFGQVAPAMVQTPLQGGKGGGWTHRGAVTLPSRRPTGLPTLPKLPKPPYLFYTEDTE